MALGERFKGSGARGIARFLSEHQSCDAGFDVRRGDPSTGGRLRITCEGCGASIDYRAAEAGQAASAPGVIGAPSNGVSSASGPAADAGLDPLAAAVTDPPPESAAPPAPRPEVRPRVTAKTSRGGLSRWLPLALIGALIAGGLAMIALGLSRSGDEQAPEPAEPVASQPAPEDEATGEDGAAAGAEAEQPPEAAGSGSTGVALKRRRFAGRIAIGVPAGWTVSRRPDGATLEAPGASAEVSVFFGPSALAPLEFARASRPFLAERHPGARLGSPRGTRFAGAPAARVRVSYAGGEELATFVATAGVMYALLRRVDRGASQSVAAEAEASTASFRALR